MKPFLLALLFTVAALQFVIQPLAYSGADMLQAYYGTRR